MSLQPIIILNYVTGHEYFCIFQYDEGGSRLLTNRFTSFVKARLLCSVPGTIPFDYNEIRKFYTCIRTTLLLGF